MKHTETFYGVQLQPSFKRVPRLAGAATLPGPRLFYWRKDAVDAKNFFRGQGYTTAHVVRVEATYTWEAKRSGSNRRT